MLIENETKVLQKNLQEKKKFAGERRDRVTWSPATTFPSGRSIFATNF